MTRVPVKRTCRELGAPGKERSHPAPSKPVEEYRALPAYVLLGDPGMGKTTLFREESTALGLRAEYVTARDFITLDPDAHAEWRDRVLFIDGLDEVRAGSADARTPLDRIRARLDHLQPPEFRLSCREADWLGENDRKSLERVIPDGKVTVLRLDPLDADSARTILRREIGEGEEFFMEEADRRGLRPLLENPLTLELLAEAVGYGGGTWPESRRETFEMACRRMVTEENEEHRIGAGSNLPTPGELLDAAGYLCSLLLLSGIEVCTPSPAFGLSSVWSLVELEEEMPVERDNLRAVLGTRLFTAAGGGSFRPVHRWVAEFLAGRYLARLVDRDRLPVGRVLSLMVSPVGRQVPVQLRGLSAWLSVHSATERGSLIDIDPVGVGLYGDLSAFSRKDKVRLLRSLSRHASDGPLAGPATSDRPGGGGQYRIYRMFGPLASPDMVPALEETLSSDNEGDSGERFLEFLMRILAETDSEHRSAFTALMPYIRAAARERPRTMAVRLAALDAYVHLLPPGAAKVRELRAFLDEIEAGAAQDPGDEMRGTLLEALYPDGVAPHEIWPYSIPTARDFYGRYWWFCNQTLLEVSSDDQVGEMLDALAGYSEEVAEALADVHDDGLMSKLLARGLEAAGDEPDITQLYRWLKATLSPINSYPSAPSSEPVRQWLGARGHILSRLFAEAARSTPGIAGGNRRYDYHELIRGTGLPEDFGSSCLDQALALSSSEPEVASILLEETFLSLDNPSVSVGLTPDVLRGRLVDHPNLLRRFDEHAKVRAAAVPYRRHTRIERKMKDSAERQKREQEEWDQHLRAHDEELRKNRLPLHNLKVLAEVYLGLGPGLRERVPRDRIARFIGGDRELVELVISALKRAIWREDVPTVSQTLIRYSENQRSHLAWPVRVSMELLGNDGGLPGRVDPERRCRALALFFTSPTIPNTSKPPCLDEWIADDPRLVLDVLTRCALASIRRGDGAISGLSFLEGIEGFDAHVSPVRMRLLRAFPTRMPAEQLPVFDRLLVEVLRQGDPTGLKKLAERKLGLRTLGLAPRVRWIMVKAILEGGAKAARDLESFIGVNERRIRHLAEFLEVMEEGGRAGPGLGEGWDSVMLTALVGLLGRSYRPLAEGIDDSDIGSSFLISGWIAALGARPEAGQGLARLIEDDRLEKWHRHLRAAREAQRVVAADASYRHPTPDQVQRTLDNRQPTNRADLAALLVDLLDGIAADIRGDALNAWRKFWNEDGYGRPQRAKPEESCRDALLGELAHRLPPGVDASPEGRYASGRRVDIRVSFNGFNIPIEIKKDSHRDLWTAINNQLVDQYTIDPATGGYGIYLVLWFGVRDRESRPDHRGARTPEDLCRLLDNRISDDKKHRILVRVIDLTKP